MLVSFSQLCGQAVFEKHTPKIPIAIVKDIVIDSDNGAVKAFWVHDGIELKILLVSDIEQYLNGKIMVANFSDLQVPNKLPVLQDVFNREYQILSAPVMVASKKIGSVSDFFIDTNTNFLVSLLVKKWWFGKKKIILKHQILKITATKILVDLNKKFVENFAVDFSSNVSAKPVSEKKPLNTFVCNFFKKK